MHTEPTIQDWEARLRGSEGVFRGIPSELYHSAPGVSQSMLQNMDPPARLPAYLTEPREVTEYMILGTLVHARILEPEKPLPGIVVQPAKYPSDDGEKPWNNNAKFCRAWHEQQRASGNVVLTENRMTSLANMVRSVSNHPAARSVLENCETELSVFLSWAEKLLLKARIDCVPIGSNVLVDIKTCEDASPEEFSKKIGDGYFIQAAYYLDLWNEAMPHDQREAFCFIAVERKPPYLVACYLVSHEDVEIGRRIYREMLHTYARCHLTNQWPGFDEGFQTLSMQGWQRAKLKGFEL